MDREMFKNMNDRERIKWVLDKYDQGYKTSDIVKEYNIPKNTLGDTMRRNGYKSNNGIYEWGKKESKKVQEEENESKKIQTRTIESEPKMILKWFENRNIENIDDFMRVITLFEEQFQEQQVINSWAKKQIERENIIEVPQIHINKNKLTGDIKGRTFHIPTKVLNDFDKFTSKKPFKKQELVAMALVEYMEKYK